MWRGCPMWEAGNCSLSGSLPSLTFPTNGPKLNVLLFGPSQGFAFQQAWGALGQSWVNAGMMAAEDHTATSIIAGRVKRAESHSLVEAPSDNSQAPAPIRAHGIPVCWLITQPHGASRPWVKSQPGRRIYCLLLSTSHIFWAEMPTPRTNPSDNIHQQEVTHRER